MAGFGDTLQQARARKGVTLKEAEQSTRINRQHLSALENEKFEALPPLIYQRGIVRNYAVYLDLDPAKMLALFEEAHGTISAPAPRGVSGVDSVPPIDMPSHWAPNFAIIAFAIVLGGILFAWGYSAYLAPSGDSGTPTLAIPTMTPFPNDINLPTEEPVTVTVAPTTQPTATTPAVAASDSATIPGRGDNQRGQANAAPTDQADNAIVQAQATQPPTQEVVEPTATTEPTEAPSTGDLAGRNQERQETAVANGTALGGISITAQGADITLTVTVDGTVEFDGVLAAGTSTDLFVGSSFQVSTSSGTATYFTDACGYGFQMGYEAGPANYAFSADGSCTP
ncbi:MAG: helix-turn-helix domain-containing protein [Thermomicrobiales bacterium]